jgi:oligoribonuclease (3'-5' exoribonuclease)
VSDPHLLLWFDLETTGLDERKESILEVGWGVTDLKLNWVVDPRSYLIENEVEWGEPIDITTIQDSNPVFMPTGVAVNGKPVDKYVLGMHARSGLWESLQCGGLISIDAAEQTILSVLDSVGGRDAPMVTMAGSGVAQFDMRWVRQFMPLLYGRLTYYTIDMGGYERVDSVLRGGGMRPSRKNAAHRAVADIEFSHRLAVRYRELLLAGADFDRDNP